MCRRSDFVSYKQMFCGGSVTTRCFAAGSYKMASYHGGGLISNNPTTRVVAAAPQRQTTWQQAKLQPVAFYLHGDGAFDFTQEAAALRAAAVATGVDDASVPDSWQWHFQYAFDVFVIPALYRHPHRTLDAHATSLHVLGLIPSAARFGYNTTATLAQRMDLVVDALLGQGVDRASASAAAARAMWTNHSVRLLVIVPAEHLMNQIGKRLAHLLLRRPDQVHLAVCDPSFGSIKPNLPFAALYKHALTLPYVVRPSFSRVACGGRPESVTRDTRARSRRVVFHGDTARYDGGARAAVRDILLLINESDMHSSTHARLNSSAYREQFALTESAMLSGAMCLVPAGDTPTSRRLFEAMAAGCVPIIVRDRRLWSYALPFDAIVKWPSFAYFLHPADMGRNGRQRPPAESGTWQSRRAEAAWVTEQRDGMTRTVHRARELARAAFCAHMDPQANPSGAADALLAVAAPVTMRERSRLEGQPSALHAGRHDRRTAARPSHLPLSEGLRQHYEQVAGRTLH